MSDDTESKSPESSDSEETNETLPSEPTDPSRPAGMTQTDLMHKVDDAFISGESAADRLSRLEEEKLAARRQAQGIGAAGKKSALAEAASKRLERVGTAKGARAADRELERDASPQLTHKERRHLSGPRSLSASEWLQKNSRAVGIGLASLLVVGAAAGAYELYTARRETKASNELVAAMNDQLGRVGEPAKSESNSPPDTMPVFPTIEAKRDASLTKLRDVIAKYPGTGAAILARLQEAGILLDKGDNDGALAAYSEVRNSALGKADKQVKGRSIEGVGLAHEARAAAGIVGALDEALKAFEELEATDIRGFKQLGMYDQARLFASTGEVEKAKTLFKTVYDDVSQSGHSKAYPYLERLAESRLRALDPSALPAKSALSGLSSDQMNDPQIQELIERLKRNGADKK